MNKDTGKKNWILTSIFCLSVVSIVFVFYYPSLFYSVKIYDEIIPFKETYLPVCYSLSEMFELISLLGLKQHFEATNTFYSNIVSLRCNPFGNFMQMLIQYFFRKNPVNYHSYSLCLHVINTALIFFILKKVSKSVIISPSVRNDATSLLIISMLTLFWAIHPVNIESVLLLTNANILLSYTFAFLTVFIYFNLQPKRFYFIKHLLLFFFYTLALFIAEFHFILPLILIAYAMAVNKTNGYLSGFIEGIKSIFSLLFADLIFILFFLFSNTGGNINKFNSLELILERIFWLSPQILFHFMKLVIFPVKLSIDQSLLVKLGKSLFDPYALFCIAFIIFVLLVSIWSFISSKQKIPFLFVIFFLFFLSLLPFSQIPAPLYNLASERYLYFPFFILIFGVSHVLFHLTDKKSMDIIITCLIAVIVVTYGTRAYIRTLDWKDNFTLYYSATKATSNPMFKAFRIKGLTPQEKIFARFPEREVDIIYKNLAIENFKIAIKNLKKEKEKYQSKTPSIVTLYGLDPASLYEKAGISLAQINFSIHNDMKIALKEVKPYIKDLSNLDSQALSFYASILYYNQMPDLAEETLKFALRKNPYSTRIIFPLCDLIQIRYGDLNKMEELTLHAFKYFPYDTFTLLILTKIYELKKDTEKYAHFSYIYGLRHHSIRDLSNSREAYIPLNKKDKAEKALKRIKDLEKVFNKNEA